MVPRYVASEQAQLVFYSHEYLGGGSRRAKRAGEKNGARKSESAREPLNLISPQHSDWFEMSGDDRLYYCDNKQGGVIVCRLSLAPCKIIRNPESGIRAILACGIRTPLHEILHFMESEVFRAGLDGTTFAYDCRMRFL